MLMKAGYRATAISVAMTISLLGCATAGNDPNLSPAENRLRQSNQRFNQTVGEGAVAGAVLGGLAGLALGGRNRAQAAALGAAGGGALGAGAGYLVARNNLSRSSTEAEFNQAIATASEDAENYRQAAIASQQIASQADSETRGLQSRLRSNQISQAQYQASLSKYRKDADLMNQQASEARKTAAAIRTDSQSASGADRTRLLNAASSIEASGQQQANLAARMSSLVAGL